MNSSNRQCRKYLTECRVCANYNRSCQYCTRKFEQPMKALVEYLCPQTCKVLIRRESNDIGNQLRGLGSHFLCRSNS
uniref:ShKT domain-containing protein n=1 Tax=Parascaris univalens TaxID=6257 RepID=A0A915CBL1_PARUN